MAQNKELLTYALDVVSQRRRDARALATAHKQELYRELPRLAQIEQELADTVFALVKTVSAGNGEAAVNKLREQNLALQKERARILEDAGLSEAYLKPQYTCPLCEDEGYSGGKLCDCVRQIMEEEKYRRLNQVSSLSLSRFDQFRLDYYPPEHRKRMEGILSVCRQYARSFEPDSGKNLFLMGATGLGKTHLSLAIASEIMGAGYQILYGSVQDLFRKVEEEHFSQRGEGKYRTLDDLLSCDLLVLDDLGSEFGTPFTVSVLYNIVNTRINRRKPTIISSNLSLKEIGSLYSDRIVSRIIGNYQVLLFQGNDVRQVKEQLSRQNRF